MPCQKLKQSDLTVADFWGIDDVEPEMNDNKGVSLVIVRTEKGKELFSAVSKELVLKSVSYEDGVRSNKSEYQSYPKPPKREAFFKDMRQMPFEKLSQKYLKVPLKVKIKKVIKAVLIKTPYGKNRWRGGTVIKHSDYYLCFVMRKNHAERDTDTI